jgi:RNA polymerase primary sigma factor
MNYEFSSSYTSEPLLNAQDEIILANEIQAGKIAAAKLEKSGKISAEEKRRLSFIARKGERARERFIRSNQKLIMKIARSYINRGMPYPDLVSEGQFGLMTAIDKFDTAKGFRFSTYATPWIRQAIGRAVTNQANLIRIPEHRANEISKILTARRTLLTELGQEPTDEDVAEKTGFTIEQIAELDGFMQKPVSLHVSVGEGDAELGDLLIDENAPDPADVVAAGAIKSLVSKMLGVLSEKESAVLALRFGIGTDEAYTLEATGDRLGLTRERIRQIERTALAKLRHPAHQHLRAYIA